MQRRWERVTAKGYVRYYEVRKLRDLLGDWTLVTSWGRRGAALGGVSITLLASEAEAEGLVRAIAARREARGYSAVRQSIH